MEDGKLKYQIGANIAAYRKRAGLTQASLGEKVNYSDKAVSKWERGESIPDVITLAALAKVLDVTVNDLLVDPNALPEETGAVQQVMERVVEKTLKRKADKRVILGLSSLLVWFVALLVYVLLSSFDIPNGWLAFFYAVPVDAIVMLSLRSAWRDFRWNRALISMIMWGVMVGIFVTLLVFLGEAGWRFWRILLLCIPGQAAILLWFRMFRKPRAQEQTDG